MRTHAVILVLSFSASLVCAGEILLDRLYEEASIACRAGDSRSAVNSWYKYLEIAKRLEDGKKSQQFKEVESNYRRESSELGMNEKLLPSDEPIETAITSSGPKQRRSVKRSRKLRAKNNYLPKLLARAEKEKAAGRFENAERLYQLALQIEPQ